ncbi:hypothetical protein QGN29_09960 [Temperatibacter marinus]|uniref:Galactose oxidase n=1 Tax=Temperatibacter marinus TaxID=1456591 RepID=A0AA52EBW5_9PROT|nr:hypothetical protein [Temperatibacter marinus]WND01875.1 hypothetical protein QGN29_09960 [Temperatibacter marinus]
MKFITAILVAICLSLGSFACDIVPLPEARSNHAVAWINPMNSTKADQTMILVAGGLKNGRTWQHVSKDVYLFKKGAKQWEEMPPLPIKEQGVLAATAVGIGAHFYIFGGYTVAEDGSEKSTSYGVKFDPAKKTYTRLPPMPTPVDDTVSFVYRERFIYLVSGWHDTGNVSLVQVYDTIEKIWRRATDYPGSPVFGHAGGIIGNQFIIADGVAVVGKTKEGRRKFDTVNEQWLGTIDPENPLNVTWKRLPQLPGKGNYRMAAAGISDASFMLFTGGSSNAYNYSGIGYNGEPSQPSPHTWGWDFKAGKWRVLKNWSKATMDHRGLVKINETWFTVGGMGRDQKLLKMSYPHQW